MFRIRKEPVRPKRDTEELSLSSIESPNWGKPVLEYIEDVNTSIKRMVEGKKHTPSIFKVVDDRLLLVQYTDWQELDEHLRLFRIHPVTINEVFIGDYSNRYQLSIMLIETDETYFPRVEEWKEKHNEWKAWYNENEEAIEAELKRREDAKLAKMKKQRDEKLKALKQQKAALERQLKELT